MMEMAKLQAQGVDDEVEDVGWQGLIRMFRAKECDCECDLNDLLSRYFIIA